MVGLRKTKNLALRQGFITRKIYLCGRCDSAVKTKTQQHYVPQQAAAFLPLIQV
jgi:hypothetical protein